MLSGARSFRRSSMLSFRGDEVVLEQAVRLGGGVRLTVREDDHVGQLRQDLLPSAQIGDEALRDATAEHLHLHDL